MLNQEFDHIVSLGSFCQTAYHLKRRFPDYKALPFDWWVTPTVALQGLVKNRFSDLFLPDNMQIVTEDAGEAVMCAHYGLMHYHDFYEAKVDDHYDLDAIKAKCASNTQKFNYLLDRLFRLEGKVLFIRVGDGWVQHYDKNGDFDKDSAAEFHSSLQNLLPNVEVHLLLLNSCKETATENLYCETVDNYGETIWYGSQQGWDEMFDRLGFGLKCGRVEEQLSSGAGTSALATRAEHRAPSTCTEVAVIELDAVPIGLAE